MKSEMEEALKETHADEVVWELKGRVLGERWPCCRTDGGGKAERRKGWVGSLRYPFCLAKIQRDIGVWRVKTQVDRLSSLALIN